MKDIMLKIVGRQIYDGQKEEDVIEITDKITINDEATLEIETGGNDHDEK